MGNAEGLVGAECFSAVHSKNNNKLKNDLAKSRGSSEKHRYVFFASPMYPDAQHLTEYDVDGIEVWSVTV